MMSLVCQHNFLKFFYMFIGAKLKQLLVHNRYKLFGSLWSERTWNCLHKREAK